MPENYIFWSDIGSKFGEPSLTLVIVIPETAIRKPYDHTHGQTHVFHSGYVTFNKSVGLQIVLVLPKKKKGKTNRQTAFLNESF